MDILSRRFDRLGTAFEPYDAEHDTKERDHLDGRCGLREENHAEHGGACRANAGSHGIACAHGNGPQGLGETAETRRHGHERSYRRPKSGKSI